MQNNKNIIKTVLGVKRLVVRLGADVVSVTFAVVPSAKPVITALTVASTIASSQTFSTELTGSGFSAIALQQLPLMEKQPMAS